MDRMQNVSNFFVPYVLVLRLILLFKDVLIAAKVDPNSTKIKHVHFEGADKDLTGRLYCKFF